LNEIAWNDAGLVPVVVQDAGTSRVLMLAWMNRAALARTLGSGFAVYWSRSRGKLWTKGESSGHLQRVRELRVDCDGDTLLLQVEQVGGIACHTGHGRCFYRRWDDGAWVEDEPILKPVEAINQ
jgi:phosphoribosyl-AMP cyclohydrolase